jgi:hypothetical protein
MSWLLVSLFIVAFVVALAFWYYTRDYRSIPDDRILDLSTDEDRILDRWYSYHIKPSIDFDPNVGDIAARFLERIYQIQVDPKLLVIGKDLDSEYFRLTRRHLRKSGKLEPNVDQIFDLRQIIGKSIQIAIIHDRRDRDKLNKYHFDDNSNLKAIMDQELDLIARDYLNEVLKYRWEKILELNDPHLMNLEGTYVYLRKCQILNVQTKEENAVHRINLLCTDIEFETLIQRWRKSLNNVSVI